MKPSELKSSAGQPATPVPKLKFPVDPKADPPISIEEALAAGGRFVRGGIIGQRGEKPGMVHLCTACGAHGMYRRFTKRTVFRPIKYPRSRFA
jgi:hypothetical protein